MKYMQYVLQRASDGQQVQWVEENAITGTAKRRTVLFDTQEEAEEMMVLFPKFFKGANLELKKGYWYIDDSINYRDLKEQDDFKKELKDTEVARTLQEVLDTDLSPDKVIIMDTIDLVRYLIFNDIVASKGDINMLIIEGVQRALSEDDEFPIKYYAKDEPMSEEGKVVDAGPCLTDEYIENNMN